MAKMYPPKGTNPMYGGQPSKDGVEVPDSMADAMEARGWRRAEEKPKRKRAKPAPEETEES